MPLEVHDIMRSQVKGFLPIEAALPRARACAPSAV